MEKYRFYILLTMLLAVLIASPLVREFGESDASPLSEITVTGVFVAMLLAAIVAVGRSRRTVQVGVSLAVPVVVLQIVEIAYDSVNSGAVSHLFAILFLAFVIGVIVRFLFTTDHVSSDTICAAISVYLLLGILFALVLSVLEVARPDSFFMTAHGGDGPIVRFSGAHSANALYFSFVTLTTLGFGDITPNSPTAKMIVTTEAIAGQLFLAILVARLVGLHITHAKSERGPT